MTTMSNGPSDAVGVAVSVRHFPVPGDLAPALQSAGQRGEPVVPRPAATVMVVRDSRLDGGGDPVEVFMLRRQSSMAFAPGRMVFPGGGVDARDADDDLPWAGPPPAQWARWLATADEAQARELVVAAAREVFEECGVLLAGADESTLVMSAAGPEWEAERDALLAREQSFSEMLVRRGLVLRTDLLRPWAHWVTPEFERRRYDTRFFVARLPEGQVPDDRTTEAAEADWVRPRALLQEYAAGRAEMLPPTVVCVEHLAAANGTRELLDAAPPMRQVMPVPECAADGTYRLRVEVPVWGVPA